MDLLTRIEELLLLTIWTYPDEAYGYGILARLSDLTGSNVTIGSLHAPLRRLVGRGLLVSWEGDSTPERGGRAKRFYKLTAEGIGALKAVHSLTQTAWEKAPATSHGMKLTLT